MSEQFKYELRILFTTGWQTMINISFENCSIERIKDDGSIRQRDQITGNVVVFGDDVQRFEAETAYKLQAELLADGDKLLDAWISMQDKTWYNQNKKELEFEILDNYSELIRNIKEERQPTNTTNGLINYETYLDSIYQGVTRGSTGVTPTDYQFCTSIVLLDAWDPNQGYLAAQVITPDEVWQGGLTQSYCSYLGQRYVCIADNTGQQPDISAAWTNIHEVLVFSQMRSIYQITGWSYNEAGGYYYLAGCTTQIIQKSVLGLDLFLSMQAHLGFYGYSVDRDSYLNYIKDNYFQEFYLMMYLKSLEETGQLTVQLSLQDYFDIYEFLFNVQWRLSGTSLEFKHPSEIAQSLPGDYEDHPFYYLDRIFAKDWSSEEFTFDLTDKIYKETIKCGDSTNVAFSPVSILYDTPFDDDFNLELQDTELDIPLGLSDETNADRVLMAYNPDTFEVYDQELSLIKLVNEHYHYNRPYQTGTIRGIEYQFNVRPQYECTITVPYYRQDLIDFDYRISTTFGELTVSEIQISMGSKSAKITAAK